MQIKLRSRIFVYDAELLASVQASAPASNQAHPTCNALASSPTTDVWSGRECGDIYVGCCSDAFVQIRNATLKAREKSKGMELTWNEAGHIHIRCSHAFVPSRLQIKR